MRFNGRAHKVGNDINTDLIISGRYKFKTLDDRELAKHVLEDLDPEFYKRIGRGDFIVAGRNFGCGSSREQAPLAIKYAGISTIIAESFARIFFRNSINIGMPVIECKDAGKIDSGDELELDMEKGLLTDKTKNLEMMIKPLPNFMLRILKDGGLVAHFRKYGGFKLD
jgi:3-isopropylmalate/(R)-2-methylmalate dehydratase small subunit